MGMHDAVHAKHEFMGAKKCAAAKQHARQVNPLDSPRLAPSRNAAIEKWVKHKEDFHLRFKYTPKMFANSVLWGLVVPISIYYLVRSEQAPPPPSARRISTPPIPPVAVRQPCRRTHARAGQKRQAKRVPPI